MGQAGPSDNLRDSGPGSGQVGTAHYVWGNEAGTGQEGPTYFRSSVPGTGQAGPTLEKVIPQQSSHFITSYSEPQQYKTEMVTEPQYYLVFLDMDTDFHCPCTARGNKYFPPFMPFSMKKVWMETLLYRLSYYSHNGFIT